MNKRSRLHAQRMYTHPSPGKRMSLPLPLPLFEWFISLWFIFNFVTGFCTCSAIYSRVWFEWINLMSEWRVFHHNREGGERSVNQMDERERKRKKREKHFKWKTLKLQYERWAIRWFNSFSLDRWERSSLLSLASWGMMSGDMSLWEKIRGEHVYSERGRGRGNEIKIHQILCDRWTSLNVTDDKDKYFDISAAIEES